MARGVQRGDRRPARPDAEDEQHAGVGRADFGDLRVRHEDVCRSPPQRHHPAGSDFEIQATRRGGGVRRREAGRHGRDDGGEA
jgi:hypothetical protein